MNWQAGWKTYGIGAMIIINNILYTMGIYAQIFHPPLDKQVSDGILTFLMGGGLMTLRHAVEVKTDETKQKVEASAIAVSARLANVEDSVANVASDQKILTEKIEEAATKPIV